MSDQKGNGPRAVAAARKTKVVASRKPTLIQYGKPPLDASAFACAWVALRCSGETAWTATIIKAAGFGGRA